MVRPVRRARRSIEGFATGTPRRHGISAGFAFVVAEYLQEAVPDSSFDARAVSSLVVEHDTSIGAALAFSETIHRCRAFDCE
jgi:hypothetical protein